MNTSLLTIRSRTVGIIAIAWLMLVPTVEATAQLIPIAGEWGKFYSATVVIPAVSSDESISFVAVDTGVFCALGLNHSGECLDESDPGRISGVFRHQLREGPYPCPELTWGSSETRSTGFSGECETYHLDLSQPLDMSMGELRSGTESKSFHTLHLVRRSSAGSTSEPVGDNVAYLFDYDTSSFRELDLPAIMQWRGWIAPANYITCDTSMWLASGSNCLSVPYNHNSGALWFKTSTSTTAYLNVCESLSQINHAGDETPCGIGIYNVKRYQNDNGIQGVFARWERLNWSTANPTYASITPNMFLNLEAAHQLLMLYAGDQDGDGILDPADNCISESNVDQQDFDGDGHGDRCDMDYNNDGYHATVLDFSVFLKEFYGVSTTLHGDHNEDGAVTIADFSAFLAAFIEGKSQPSGIACAGSADCDAPFSHF